MREGWENKKFGEVCSFVRGPFGGSLKKSMFVDRGYAVYEQQHAIKNQFETTRYFVDENKFQQMKRFELLSGDLIMSCSGTMGKVAKVPVGIQRGIINQALLKISTGENLDTDYLVYWMESPDFQDQLAAETTGVAIKNVASVKVLKEIDIPLPHLAEQKRIVAVLDQAFAGIEQALAAACKNLSSARELFETTLNTTFTQKGEGWVTEELNKNIKFIDYRGKTPPKTQEGIRLITAKNVKMGFIQRKPEEFIDETAYEAWMTRGFPKFGDVLFTTEAPLGKVAQLDTHDIVVIGQRLITMQPVLEILDATFLKFLLMSQMMQKEILARGTGATVLGIKAKLLKKIPIHFPKSISEQQQIVSRLEKVSTQTQRLEALYQQKIDALNELKQSLLQKAFAGELTHTQQVAA